MDTRTINAQLLAKMFLAGAKNLESKKEWINDLNVFPVPDGDTGTNMTMTIMSAAKEVAAIENPSMKTLAKSISAGSLRGARGNSGVILSQLCRGFAKGMQDYEELDIPAVTAAFQKAVETAYKAVMKPKEGTILTVARGVADKAWELSKTEITMEDFLSELLEEAESILSRTPEMLPVLKEAGVVDSGGQGLVQVLKGAYDAFLGKEIDITIPESEEKPSVPDQAERGAVLSGESEIRFGYCTEFIIMPEQAFTEETEAEFKDFLESIGDSIVLVSDEDIVKVHVHTNDPGKAISQALTYGSLSRMKIDNMREEHHERVIKDSERLAAIQKEKREEERLQRANRKPVGFIAVSAGEGFAGIFRELGVDELIEGGQTMNPSTEDILEAVAHVNADTVFVLPNNKNIVLAANQAKLLEKERQVIVIPTRTIPQGIAAVVGYSPDRSPEENTEVMMRETKNVCTGQVTYAVRDTCIEDIQIREGDIMGLGDDGLLAVGQDIGTVALQTLEKMAGDDTEMITAYYGADVEKEDADVLEKSLNERYPDCEVEVYSGGQPIYYYILSAE